MRRSNARDHLASRMQGGLLQPNSPGFDEARNLWNARFDRRPDVIAQCRNAADVQTVVEYVRTENVPLSVKGGGHSYGGNSVRDGGVLIDLSAMKQIHVDVESKTVTLQGGVTCGELDAATQQHGLATPTPTTSSVGVAGATLGGGSGYLSRRYGLCIDNLVSAQVVTAEGKIVEASEDENPDLFWALRGGGGNFGVATSLQLALHEVSRDLLVGQVIYPIAKAGNMLRFFREYMAEAPNQFQCYPFMFRVPPIEPFPQETHGQPVLNFVLFHGDPEAEDFVQPIRDLGEPILDFVSVTPYVEVQQTFDSSLPAGNRYYSKSQELADLTDEAIDTVVEHVTDMRGEFTAAYFSPNGGVIAEVAGDATAYGSREASYDFHCLAGWTAAEADGNVMSWASDLNDAMAEHSTGGVYVNLIADDEDDRVPEAYGQHYQRLRELKRGWDPTNLFSSNYNIPPA